MFTFSICSPLAVSHPLFKLCHFVVFLSAKVSQSKSLTVRTIRFLREKTSMVVYDHAISLTRNRIDLGVSYIHD